MNGHAVQEKLEEHHQQKKDDFIENTAPKHSKRILKSEPELQGYLSIFINLVYLSGCLSVCVHPVNIKTTKKIRPKLFYGNSLT